MNKKALSLAICMAMALPTASNALSLGEIESKSSLNQPFQGKINLLSTSVAEAKNLRIRVAPAEVFNRVGIDRPAFLNGIRFRTTVQNGKPVILVNSNQPINEPFLNFLLEVSWPNGQLLKEYTVLLDPPVLLRPDTAIASNNAGVRAEPKAQGRITRPIAQQRSAPQAVNRQTPQQLRQAQLRQAQQLQQQVAATQRRTSSSNYRVRRGDTLSKIANNMGYRGVRKDQMMVALFEKNRKAFSRSNMNNLKAGALIARPSLQEARSLGSKAAKSQVIAQAREWKKKRAELLAKKGKTAVASNDSARMEVMGKSEAGDASGSSTGKGGVAGIKQQLAMMTESLTTKQQENEELKSRVTELESLLRKKNRLITLKSEQLAGLQAGLGGVTTDAPSESPIAEPNVIANEAEIALPEPTVANEGTDIQEQVANSIANENGEIIRAPIENIIEPTPVILEEPLQAEAKQEPTSAFKNDAVEEPFDLMGLLGSPAAMGIGGGSLLALLGGLWYARRKRTSEAGEVEDFSNIIDDGLNDKPMDGDKDQEEPILNNDMIDESEFVMHDEVQSQSAESVVDVEENELDDLIQEADVYIVYGLHDQAESEIKRAITNYPDNAALHAKLLENYKAAGDKDAFEETTKAFLDLDTDDKQNYWDEICEWGTVLLPESKLYDRSSVDGIAVAAAATGAAMVAGTAVASDADKEVDQTLEELTEEKNAEDVSDVSIEESASDEFEKIDVDTELDDFDLDDILNEDDEAEVVADITESEVTTVDVDDEFDIEIDVDNEAETNAEIEIDSMDFSLDDDSLDTLLDSEEFSGDSTSEEFLIEDDHEITNLDLELDSDDFDKIMPEEHAYKATEEKIDEVVSSEEKLGDDEFEDNILADFDDNLSFLDLDGDSEVIEETQIATKIDLAKAYIDMGDIEGARSTLEEVMEEGSDDQKREAEELLHNNG